MARTVITMNFQNHLELVDQAVREVLIGDGYKEINRNNEVVWKKGTGMMTAMHFIKLEYDKNVLNVYGWVQTGIGSVGGKEQELKGFVASIPKKSVLKTVDKIRVVVR